GGNMGTTGSVAVGFRRMGVFRLEPADLDPEELELELIDAGLEELGESESEKGEPQLVVRCELKSFGEMQSALEERGITVIASSIDFIPNTTVSLDEAQATEV